MRYDYHNYLRTALNPARHYLNDESLSFQNMVGEYDGSLYAYFKVQDEKVIYRDKEALSVYRSDFLQISMLARDGSGVKNYVVAPYGPEPIYPYEVESDYSNPEYEGRITGQWYETADGYEIELQIPMQMLGERLGFTIFDVDDISQRTISTVVATYKVADAERLGSLRLPTPEIDRIVAGMNHNNSRIQVVDFSGRVLLTVGDIQSATGLQLAKSTSDNEENKYWELLQSQIFRPLYDRFLIQPTYDFIDELYSAVTREGEPLNSALTGVPLTQFRTLTDTQTRI